MLTWWTMFICNLLIAVLMIATGAWMRKGGTKTVNPFLGYRTTRSMKNADTWEFAHRYFGRLWFVIGLILLLPTALAQIPFYNSSEDTAGTVGLIVCVAEMAALILPVIPTELALKRNFNDDGTRK